MKRPLALVAVLVLLSSCSAKEQIEWRNGPPPTCDTTSRGRLLLMAQSAPEATLIPCIGSLPPGWEFVRASSQTSQSVLVFSNDTFDLDVDVVLTPACDTEGAQQSDSPRPATELYVASEEGRLVFTFEGGCIAFHFETPELARSLQGRELVDAVPFMTRDTLRELSGWTL